MRIKAFIAASLAAFAFVGARRAGDRALRRHQRRPARDREGCRCRRDRGVLEAWGSTGGARTTATHGGFDFSGASDGGAAYTAIVYRTADSPTMRAAIENPGGHLSAPQPYPLQYTPWSWDRIVVHEESVGARHRTIVFGGSR